MDFSFLIIGNFFQRMAFCISITKVFLLLEDAIASKKYLGILSWQWTHSSFTTNYPLNYKRLRTPHAKVIFF